ncbi:MAG TPA: prolyl oligopeptidase family serine peptidase [Gemmatimonadaceae bacterium]|nr:prolyl oligopeptidase family serine peptidase [Gemmatimonadaceae bacterium]
MIRRLLPPLAAALWFATATPIRLAAQGAPALTIEQLLATPFPTEIAAAPRGGAVAWVLNERGRRNIWVAEPPAYAGRRLTNYTEDDGQEVTSLTWAPDGASLVFVRGGARNRAGESPNPAQLPNGAESAIHRVALAGGAPVRLGGGTAPTISPDGKLLLVSRGKLWGRSLTDEKGDFTEFLNIRGGMGNVRWSPDGSKLAYVSSRGDHAFIAVVDVATKQVTWLGPSVDTDRAPVWSPDGRRIAFLREPANSELYLFKAQRTGRPWSIMIGDVSTGTVRTAWTADEGDGSVPHDVVGPDQLMWGDGDVIVFPWEKDGWNHLYSVPVAGGRPTLLTPGDGEVEYVRLSRDRREVFYNANIGDIDRRHLWRVHVKGGTPVAVTRGDGIEWGQVELSDGSLAFLRSDARTPAHAVRLAGGDRATPLAPALLAGFPSARLVVPQAVTVTAPDGMQVPAQLFLPPDARPGERHPAAIFFHGGSRRQMLLGYNYGEYYHNAYAFNQYLASRGFVVLSVNYRSGIGYGLAFREAVRYGAEGASEFNDVVGAGLYLRNRPDVDPRRIAPWGGSYGGYLTAMGLARAPELFAAGVDIHGVHDWNVGIRTFVPDWNVLLDPPRTRLARESSPLAYLDRWKAPVLVIHGDDDRNVSFAETITLVEQLRERKVEVEQLVFPDEVHSFLRHSSWLAAFSTAAEFLARRLR